MVAVIDIEPIRERFSAVAPFLDERGRRLVAAAEAFAAGYGGTGAGAMWVGVWPRNDLGGLERIGPGEPPPPPAACAAAPGTSARAPRHTKISYRLQDQLA